MRTRIETLSQIDNETTLDVMVEAELARCGILDETRARSAIRAEFLHARDIAERYEFDGEEDFVLDPVFGAAYVPID